MIDPLLDALGWAQQALFGQLATILAVIGIATVGVQMLSGRIVRRQALATVGGCFIIFGAATISSGISNMPMPPSEARDAAPRTTIVPKASALENFDPYAGAAAITRPLSKDDFRKNAQSN